MYEKWKPVFTALAADTLDKLGYRDQAMDHDIRPSTADAWFAGPAITLDAYPSADSVPDPYGEIFAAYELMKPGEVVVIATNGEVTSGLWGELLATAAKARGVTSVVTDGLVRDIRQMNEMGCGCFSRGYSPLDSAGRCLPKEVGGAVTCGGVRVERGDLVLADFEGVVAVPAAIADEVHRQSLEKLAGENTVRDELEAGALPREVFDKYGIL